MSTDSGSKIDVAGNSRTLETHDHVFAMMFLMTVTASSTHEGVETKKNAVLKGDVKGRAQTKA